MKTGGGGSGSTVPHIPNLGARRKCAVAYTHGPIYSREQNRPEPTEKEVG